MNAFLHVLRMLYIHIILYVESKTSGKHGGGGSGSVDDSHNFCSILLALQIYVYLSSFILQ